MHGSLYENAESISGFWGSSFFSQARRKSAIWVRFVDIDLRVPVPEGEPNTLEALGRASLVAIHRREDHDGSIQGGNKCHNPDFLGFSLSSIVCERFWGGELFVHVLIY